MSKSKSRQLSKQASSTAKRTVKISEAPKDTVQLAETAKDTAQLTEDTQETSPLTEDTSEAQTSTNGKLATSAKEKPTSSTGKKAAASTKEKPTSTASKQAAAASAKERQSATARAQPPVHRPLTHDGAKYERRQAERQSRFLAERRAKRIRNTVITVIALVVIVGGGLTGYFIYNARLGSAQAARTQQAFQEPIFNSDFPPVDNVYCDQLEQTVEHIHAHLTIYINGQNFALPANIGIATDAQAQQTTCFYWLHVHQQNPGVIHIEAPTTEPFTLGQFLDEWDQQFNSLGFPTELTLSQGWTAWVNGTPYHGDFRSVALDEHALITIAYNSPNVKPDKVYNWGAQGL